MLLKETGILPVYGRLLSLLYLPSMVWYFPGFVNSYFRFLYNNLIL